MSKLSDFLTVGEAAEHLGVSRDSLRRWDRSGKLKARRHPITGYRLYLRDDLDRLLRRLTGTHRAEGSDQAPTRRVNAKK
jgi:excisionase family DNA binding protein